MSPLRYPRTSKRSFAMQRPNFSHTAIAAAVIAIGSTLGSLAYAAGTTGSTDKSNTSAGSMGSTGTMSSSSKDQASTTLQSRDRKFIEKAAQGGLAEVQLGQLAEQKASNDQVKQFGKRMVSD